MGGGGSREIAHIYSHVNRYDTGPGRDVLTRVSTFVFGDSLPDLLPDVTEAMVTDALPGPTLPFPTGKIGIQLETRHTVEEFRLLFEGRRYEPQLDSSVTNELGNTFGLSPHMKWYGYKVLLPPPTDRFAMSALLRINVQFKPDAQSPSGYSGVYAVAMVFGFFNTPFSQHYALGVTTLQPDATTLVDTSVRLRL
ncbi:MAG TPA: hypothetical protein VGU22_15555 [Methylomirabilota bacterium]|nr:hypothetical protein [Methylomirabilota bacterium]